MPILSLGTNFYVTETVWGQEVVLSSRGYGFSMWGPGFPTSIQNQVVMRETLRSNIRRDLYS